MENRAHAFTAGLFVLLLGLAAVLALWWFGNDQDLVTRYMLVSEGNITGLNEQAQVRYRGIRAGKVEAIDIDPNDPRQILVRISMRRNFPVTRGTRASLGYLGVTGIAYVQLSDKGEDPAPLPPGPDGLPRLSLQSGGLVDQLSDVGMETMRKIQGVADRVGKVLDDTNLARLSHTLERLESASESVDRTLRDAPQTLASLRAALSPDNLAHISQTLSQLDAASQEVAPTVRELRNLAVKLTVISERLDHLTASADPAGTLARVDGLLQELTETSRRMSRLLEDVEASPQMLVFGRGHSTPGPGEAGFKAPARKE
jgi:phospholipid/cholesterol/gamma-HCH transport system substrate-binding protein